MVSRGDQTERTSDPKKRTVLKGKLFSIQANRKKKEDGSKKGERAPERISGRVGLYSRPLLWAGGTAENHQEQEGRS